MKKRDRDQDMRKLAKLVIDCLPECFAEKRPFGSSDVERDVLEAIDYPFPDEDDGSEDFDQDAYDDAIEEGDDYAAMLLARFPKWLAAQVKAAAKT